MQDNQISAKDLEVAYKCSFSDDSRMVTVVIGTQWIQPCRLQFGEDIPLPASGVTPEQFQVLLEIPLQDGFAMMAMAKAEIYSHPRQQHARFGKSVDREDFLTKLTGQIHRVIKLKRGRGLAKTSVTRMPLERLVDEINEEPLKGDVGLKGRQFVTAWLDKNLAITGDVGETLFLANALKLYKNEYARRHFNERQEEQAD